jgi:hypothetical protein
MLITRGDGRQISARGFDDPQAMRMILLQILTGRRASEIRTCLFDCLSPVPDKALDAAEGEQIARFHYAQSKIDIAPDNILVDREVVAVIEEQRQWGSGSTCPTSPRGICSCSEPATGRATSPTRRGPMPGCSASSARSHRSPTARAGQSA